MRPGGVACVEGVDVVVAAILLRLGLPLPVAAFLVPRRDDDVSRSQRSGRSMRSRRQELRCDAEAHRSVCARERRGGLGGRLGQRRGGGRAGGGGGRAGSFHLETVDRAAASVAPKLDRLAFCAKVAP